VSKAKPTEEALAAIHAIRQTPESYDLKRELAPFLRHKSNHVIAAAADTAARFEAVALAPELAAAFEELMRDPARRDPGCKALIAIAKALAMMDEAATRVFYAGLRHVQKEGSFGPPVDVAAPLRGLCAQGLARMSHPDALLECVTLLADPELPARAGALRAIADAGRPEGVLLLRLKALVGDSEDEIMAECFAALLRLDPAHSLEFVAGFLRSRSEAIAESAALALGESRLATALPVLREAWERIATPERRQRLLFAIALLRNDEGLEFLLERLIEETESVAAAALQALGLYARDAAVRARVEEIVKKRKSAALDTSFEREFSRL
jgi:hypothetical protein